MDSAINNWHICEIIQPSFKRNSSNFSHTKWCTYYWHHLLWLNRVISPCTINPFTQFILLVRGFPYVTWHYRDSGFNSIAYPSQEANTWLKQAKSNNVRQLPTTWVGVNRRFNLETWCGHLQGQSGCSVALTTDPLLLSGLSRATAIPLPLLCACWAWHATPLPLTSERQLSNLGKMDKIVVLYTVIFGSTFWHKRGVQMVKWYIFPSPSH